VTFVSLYGSTEMADNDWVMTDEERHRIAEYMAGKSCMAHPDAGFRLYKKRGGIHYLQARCKECDRMICWIPKPESKVKKRKSLEGWHWYFEQQGIDFCQVCFRKKEDLPIGHALEVHHLIAVENEGKDQEDNLILVCTRCHRLIHVLREDRKRELAPIDTTSGAGEEGQR